MTPQEPTDGAFIKGILLGIVPGAIALVIVNVPIVLISIMVSQKHFSMFIISIVSLVIGSGLAYASGFWKRPLTLMRGVLTGLVIGYFGALATCFGPILFRN